MIDPCLPFEAEIVDRVEESEHIFTLRLRLTDPGQHEAYRFRPGQFNMVYLYGVGEVPIVPPPGAIANAIYRAVGVRMGQLPMTPARILKKMGVI